MFEFEIIYKATGEHDFLFGYSQKNLVARYPDIDPNSYDIISREFID